MPAPSLKDLKFRNNADARIRKAAEAGDLRTFHKALNSFLSGPRKRFEKEFAETPFVAFWSVGAIAESADTELGEIATAVAKKAARKGKPSESDISSVSRHVISRLAGDAKARTPLLVLTGAELLLRYSKQLSAEDAATLFVALSFLDPAVPAEDNAEDPGHDAIDLIQRAELPFVLGNLLDGQAAARGIRAAGAAAAAETIDACTDTDGTLHAATARHADQWAAPIVRISGWAMAFDMKWGTKKVLGRWDKTIERLASLLTPDGLMTQYDQTETPEPGLAETQLQIIRHAARIAQFDAESDVAALLRKPERSRKKRTRENGKQKKRHIFSEQSDWAEAAVLRSGVSIDADVAGLMWDQPTPELCLASLGTKIIGGAWGYTVSVDGKRHETVGEWVCTCWFQDKEVAFAELEAGADDGVRHVRHVMLSLVDHYAVVTDSVTCEQEDAEIECVTTLPLSANVVAEENPITRELLLQAECHSVRAVPAWLDDDRVQNALGRLQVKGGVMEMSARGKGGVTMPLVLDWHPERIAGDADWNSLTVTEERDVVLPWQAAGYRVRIASLQLLLYRSLRQGETLRAVLGVHTARETVYGRFRKDGEMAPLVLVESEA